MDKFQRNISNAKLLLEDAMPNQNYDLVSNPTAKAGGLFEK